MSVWNIDDPTFLVHDRKLKEANQIAYQNRTCLRDALLLIALHSNKHQSKLRTPQKIKKPIMHSIRFLLLSIMISILAGCATQAPTLDFSPKDVLPVGKKIDYEVKTITVSVAKEEERLGETQVGLFGNQYESSFRTSLKDAIEEALAKAAIFNDNSLRKLSVTVKVMKFETPHFSTSFGTNMIVRYQLIDRENGKLVFTRDVESNGEVPFNYAFIGAIRYTEARNRAVRENITSFISTLGEFKVAQK